MAKERIHSMPETKGTFVVKGIASGVEKQNFYTEKKTRTGKDFRAVNFGVSYNENQAVYMSLNGMPRDEVYFSKKIGEKTETKKVNWANRNKPDPDGYRIIGDVLLGLAKTVDEKGKEVNDKKTMVGFDACKYIAENMVDDSSVYIRGKMDYSSFTNKNGDVSRSTKFIPTQISLCQDVDFAKEGYEPENNFTQTIVFVGIDQEKDSNDKPTGRFVVESKIVNYNSIESAAFIIEDSKLAKMFKTNLKPYWGITVHGKISVSNAVEAVENEDCWGEENKMNRVSAPTKRELIITGATPSTMDKESYSEKAISEAIRKMNAAKEAEQNFTGNVASVNDSDWGTSSEIDDDLNDSEPW